MKKLAMLLVLLSACASAVPPKVTADNSDIEAVLRSTYDVISGPAGTRDWERLKGLFAPGARLVSVRKDGPAVMTPDDYITRAGAYFEKNGFFERSVSNRVERYGDIAHVFSTYESRHNANDATPFARGINSFQLVRIGGQWKVLTIFWQQEDEAHPIPAMYL
jgi:Domain of unknown function (DUF4440)